MVKEFSQEIMKFKSKQVQSSAQSDASEELKKLFNRLQRSKKSLIDPSSFYQVAVPSTRFKQGTQHDSAEFSR